jgi:hypothetical protein
MQAQLRTCPSSQPLDNTRAPARTKLAGTGGSGHAQIQPFCRRNWVVARIARQREALRMIHRGRTDIRYPLPQMAEWPRTLPPVEGARLFVRFMSRHLGRGTGGLGGRWAFSPHQGSGVRHVPQHQLDTLTMLSVISRVSPRRPPPNAAARHLRAAALGPCAARSRDRALPEGQPTTMGGCASL